jgi:hypothetical protein
MRVVKLFVLLAVVTFCVFLYYKAANKAIECYEDLSIPTVSFPFKNLFDDKGKKLNIILISAPFREDKHMDQYNEYKKKGLSFCGISSYLEFPGKIINPYEDRYHEEKGHNYIDMVSSWLHCFRQPPPELTKSKIPYMLMTEANLKDTDAYKPDPKIEKKYDFIYVCLKDNDNCDPGWQSYIRSWDLAKECLKIMCRDYGLKGVLIGRKNCEFTDHCLGIVEVIEQLDFDQFQKKMQECRFLFVPNVSDASPRVITEAMSYNMPVLCNYNIVGGWDNIMPGVTGEFFTSEEDISFALDNIVNHYDSYQPRRWFSQNRGKKRSGRLLADFLIKNYPNINNKKMEYATITI